MNKPLMSIVIPVYNYAHVVARALNSVISQLDETTELLIINDGSTDHSDEIITGSIEPYVSQKNIRYIAQKNAGLSVVRNRGIDETSGEYLIFLDADDELCVGALAAIKQFLANGRRPGLLAGTHISVFADGREKQAKLANFANNCEQNFIAYLQGQLRLANGPTVLNRKVFDGLRYPENLRQSEDLPVFALILANYDATAMPDALVKIHKSATSMRHDYQRMRGIGIQPVEYLFAHPVLPAPLHKYYRLTRARRYLSMSRSAYLANQFADCRNYYLEAFALGPLNALSLSYLKKFIKALFRRST